MTLAVFCFYDCDDNNKIVGYKIRRVDGKKLPNGRKYTTNKYMTKDEAFRRLSLVELSNMHRDM